MTEAQVISLGSIPSSASPLFNEVVPIPPAFSRAKRPDRAHHDWVSLAVPVGAAHLLVPGLQPHMPYQFSILAQNKLGSGPFSEIVLSVPEGEVLSPEPLPSYTNPILRKAGSQGCTGSSRVGGSRWVLWRMDRLSRSFGRDGDGVNCRGGDTGRSVSASLSHSGFPTTTAPPRLPSTEMSLPLSPPRGLVAVRTPRGVLLHWDPPELVPVRLDGYILEGRQGSQGWEVLDPQVAGTDMELLVPGLIKVSSRAHGAACRLPQRVPPAKPFPKGLGVGAC